LGVIALLILLAFALLVSRLWRLQVREGENLRSLSENNRLRLKRTPPLRGVVYDRQGRVLVDNRPSFNVVLVPEDSPDVKATLHALSYYLADNVLLRGEALPRNPRRPSYEGVVLARDVAWSTLVAVESHQADIPGVDVEVSTKRQYPPEGLAAHLLGYVGEVNSQEMSVFPKYRLGDLIGKFGIEKTWEADLRGQGAGNKLKLTRPVKDYAY
jgi:penicillin-binding protein 2